MSKRAMATVFGGAVAVALMSGCGAVNGAIDCVSAGETMMDITGKVTGDEKPLKESTAELRDQAEGIEDKDLKQSALDFADQAEAINSASNGDVAEGAETDPGELKTAVEDFQSQCSSLTE